MTTDASEQAISLAKDILDGNTKAEWSADWPFEMAQGVIDLSFRVKELESLRRFLEWDALTALPDPLPAPFADLPYWVSEFKRVLSE